MQHNRLVFIQLFMVIGTDIDNSSHRVNSSTHSRDQMKKRGKVMDTIIWFIFPQSKRDHKTQRKSLKRAYLTCISMPNLLRSTYQSVANGFCREPKWLHTLKPSLNSWNQSRSVISAIWKCELKSTVMATFLLLFPFGRCWLKERTHQSFASSILNGI